MLVLLKKALWIVLILSVLLGCSRPPTQAPTVSPTGSPNPLSGTYWTLIRLNGQPLIRGTRILLHFSGLEFNGNAGCNSYHGGYGITGQQGVFEITIMDCMHPDLMAQETAYTDQLGQILPIEPAKYRITHTGSLTQLELLDANGQAALVYQEITQADYQLLEATTYPSATPSSVPSLTPTPFTEMVPPGARLRLSKGSASIVSLSPDGQVVLVGNQITLCAYRVADGAEVWCRTPGEQPMSTLRSLLLSPDGKTAATGLDNGLLVLWDTASGAQRLTIRTDTPLDALAWSPDSQRVAGVLDNGSLGVWRAQDGSSLAKIQTGSDLPGVIQWSPDGKSIAGGTGYNRTVTVWDVNTGRLTSTFHFFPEGHAINSLAWSADSTLILAGSSYVSCYENCTPTYAGLLVLLDARTGVPRWQIDAGHQVHALALSPDGTQVLARVGFDAFQLYRLSDGARLRSFPASGLVGAFWLPDGKRLLSLDGGDTLVVWDLTGAALASVHLDGYAAFANLAWSPDGSELAASQWNGPVVIWNPATGQLLRTFGSAAAGGSLAWSPDGAQIATQGRRQTVIWDAQTGVKLRTLPDAGEYFGDLAWSPDGRLFASMTDSGVLGTAAWTRSITLWDAHTWQQVRIIQRAEDNYTGGGSLAWSPDGQTLAADGGGLFLWDVVSGAFLNSLGDPVSGSLQWSADGSRLLTNVGSLWDVRSQILLLQLGGNSSDPNAGVNSAALSPGGTLLATGGDHIILRSPSDGAILQVLPGAANRPEHLAFSPDGQTLASLSEDGTLLVWDVPPISALQPTPTLAAVPIAPNVTGPSVSPLQWSPDSRWLPYLDFTAGTLHFMHASSASTCAFPTPIHYTGPDHLLTWLPDGRVVVQAANGVEAGFPCSDFSPATPPEILALDRTDPSYSPDGRYQVVEQDNGNSQGSNFTVSIQDTTSGKSLAAAAFVRLAQGGGTITGSWLDGSHFLIPSTGDQGPLLLAPGSPVTKIASDIFNLPLKPGSGNGDIWIAVSDAGRPVTAPFHLMLMPAFASSQSSPSNPLQIYHSETGQLETLPYLVSQGAFSNDGHWLLVSTATPQGEKILIRPLDPPGSAFLPFSAQPLALTWSPDGSRYYQVSQDQTTLTAYAFPSGTLLGSWQALDYELSPSWLPDGKYLVVWACKHSDYNQEAIFMIPVNHQ